MDDLISRGAALDAISTEGGCGMCASRVLDIPAVDAAPVVHGRWIETQIPANTTGHGGVGQDKKKRLALLELSMRV